jgi:primosomal protein N' (replication factor Y)
MQELISDIKSGKHNLLIGTQMLAKGHHFPNVTLVAIINVDQGLFGIDLRASERMAQLIVQVSGRAGRADKPGRVLIQSWHPDHPLLQTLIHNNYATFAAQALAEREQAEFPPYSALVMIRAEATDADSPFVFLNEARELANGLVQGVEIFGPLDAPMKRRAGRYRAQLLLQAANRQPLQRLMNQLAPRLEGLKSARKVRWSIDVDPQEML